MTSSDAEFMRMAIDEAEKSTEGNARVGVVIVRDGRVLVAGHKGEDGTRKHAESIALDKATESEVDLRGSTAYVTLEPCANLQSKTRICCAELLAAAGVSTVFIGKYDLNPQINRLGWRTLRDRNVHCRDFYPEFRAEIEALNAPFDGFFLERSGSRTGTAKFDFSLNGGRYVLSLPDEPSGPTWTTRWSSASGTAVDALGGVPGVVALARYAEAFDEIDDPDALDFGSHFARVTIGGVAVFRNEHGHALCLIREIEASPPYGIGPHVSLKFDFELRPHSEPATEHPT